MAERIKVSLSLYPEEIKELDAMAKAVGVNRSELIRRMLRKEQLDDKAIGVLEWLTSHNVRYAEIKKEKRRQAEAGASEPSSQDYQNNTKLSPEEQEIISHCRDWIGMSEEELERAIKGY